MNNLLLIFLRLRVGEYVTVGDIEQMFHQIKVTFQDQDALRCLWRSNVNSPIEKLIMLAHLFGEKDSPCCAKFVLRKPAVDNERKKNLKIGLLQQC